MPLLTTRVGLLALSVLVLAGYVAGQDSQPASKPAVAPGIPLRDWLVIEPVGRYGRAPVHVDAIEALLVSGQWSPPTAGQAIELANGSTRTWQAVQAAEDGLVQHAALRGGYAFASVMSNERRTMLLEASGHSLVYVNGRPRAGDPYQTNYVRLPVSLEPGANQFLFACARGELRARLLEPDAPLLLDVRDLTLPDLVVGQPVDAWGAVVVVNTLEQPLTDGVLSAQCVGVTTATNLPPVPACSIRKVGFRFAAPAPGEAGNRPVELQLSRRGGAEARPFDSATLSLRVRRPDESRKCTFISDTDGSVQYYAVQPMRPESAVAERPALFLTLHGAGVEGLGQADAYRGKSWGHIVAPTNRRPFGFDWEDWGRLDAMEVLALAEMTLGTDPLHTYLTGHSMGGHGTWQVGVTFPDRFAAIAPSAGWISFWSYAGAERFENLDPIEEILTRATNPSDTLALSRNYLLHGVYILHGSADDNVPVEQARTMRQHLGGYHTDFAYYERPGAGHWWGSECVDWPPLFDFLKNHARPATQDVTHIEFVTANPAVSATCYWAMIQAQQQSLKLSKLDLTLDREKRVLRGTTENVSRLTIALPVAPPPATAPADKTAPATTQPTLSAGQPLGLDLDGQTLADVPWPAQGRLDLTRHHGSWSIDVPTPADSAPSRDLTWPKNPQRGGPFKEVFRHCVQLVYGTRGTPEENAWAFAKARYDAETFWYRGNGSFDVLPDTAFLPDAQNPRNVVLYGNADTNAAWSLLFAHCPVQVSRGQVRVAAKTLTGDDLAVLAIAPYPGDDEALVGVVSGTGVAGMRLTDRLPYFLSGVAYPDWVVLGPDILREGVKGVRAAGFFANDWSVDAEQSAWRDP